MTKAIGTKDDAGWRGNFSVETLPMWKYFLAWFPMILIAIANGALREIWYGPHLSELHAHQASTILGMLLFGVYMWAIFYVWRPLSSVQALAIGFLWLSLTVVFELLFFHYVLGLQWSLIVHDYNVFAGRVWVLLLIWITVAPYVFYRSRA